MELRQTFYKTCIVLATIVGIYLLYELWEILTVLFVAIIFASAVRPLVRSMMRFHIPQSLAIVLIYIGTFVGLLLLLVITIPPLATLIMDFFSGNELVNQLNVGMLRFGLFLNRQFQLILPVLTLPQQFQDFLAGADETVIEQAWPFAQSAFYVLGQIFLAVVMSIYWLVARKQMLGLLLQLSPREHRHQVYLVWTDIEETLGAFVRGQVILMFLVGLASYLGLLVLRVPNALALGILAGLLEAVPYAGPFLGAIPAVLAGFANAPLTGILVGVWYVIVQQLEGNFLVPKIMEKSLGLNPLLVIVALVAGYTLNGVVGALLALPVASAAQVVMRHLWLEPALQESFEADAGALEAQSSPSTAPGAAAGEPSAERDTEEQESITVS